MRRVVHGTDHVHVVGQHFGALPDPVAHAMPGAVAVQVGADRDVDRLPDEHQEGLQGIDHVHALPPVAVADGGEVPVGGEADVVELDLVDPPLLKLLGDGGVVAPDEGIVGVQPVLALEVSGLRRGRLPQGGRQVARGAVLLDPGQVAPGLVGRAIPERVLVAVVVVQLPVLEHHHSGDYVDAALMRAAQELFQLEAPLHRAHQFRQLQAGVVGDPAIVVLAVHHQRIHPLLLDELQVPLQIGPLRHERGEVDAEAIRGLALALAQERVRDARLLPALHQAPGALKQAQFPGGFVRAHLQAPAAFAGEHAQALDDLAVGIAGEAHAAPALAVAAVQPVAETAGKPDQAGGLGVVAHPGDLLVESGAAVELSGGGERGVLPACSPVGGLVEAVEGGAQQQGAGIVRGQGHGGEISAGAQGLAPGDLHPGGAVVLGEEHLTRGGHGHARLVRGVHPQGGQAPDPVLGEGVDHPAGEALVALDPACAQVEGHQKPSGLGQGIDQPPGGAHGVLEAQLGGPGVRGRNLSAGGLAARVPLRHERDHAAAEQHHAGDADENPRRLAHLVPHVPDDPDRV